MPTGGQAEASNIAMTTRFARPVELLIAMQLGSMSLHKRLEDCREQGFPGVPVAELLEYLEQAARGIDFLNKPIHDLGKGPVPIVHGDVKPHNILVVGDAAVVCDFGLARAVETLRKTSMAPVTVAYAAPESFKGKVTPTSDQYSLAITYAELRTGRLPFDETMTPYQVMEAHVTRMLDFSRLPEPEQAVILRGTESNPEDRWPSSRDLILALRQAVAQTGELPLRPGEIAFTGGPTPSHALTGRPMMRETGRHTQAPVDPRKETMHPGGHTPSQLLSRQTAQSPASERTSSGLAETAMLGVQGTVLAPPAKKSRGMIIGGVGIGAVAIAAVVIAVMALNKSDATLPKGPGNQGGSNNVAKNDEPPSSDPNAQFIKAVQDKINAGNFEAAIKDLQEKAPSSLPAFEKEALQKRLKTAFLSYIDSKVQSGSYSRALSDLEDAPPGIGLTDDDKKQQREKIRAAWLAEARDELENEQFPTAFETASALLKKFDGDRDAQFIAVRAQIRQGDYAKALTALNKLGPTAGLPAEYQPLDAGLLLLATGMGNANSDALKLLDGLLDLAALEKKSPPPAALALSNRERESLGILQKRVVDDVQKLLEGLPADQKKALLAKLEQLGSNADVQMSKVKLLLDEKQFAEARKTLVDIAAKAPADDGDLKTEITATGWLIDLSDPATPPAETAKAVAQATAQAVSLTPVLRGQLSAAATALALGTQPALLDSVLALVKKYYDLDPGDAEMAGRVAKLLAAQLTLRPAQQTVPSKDELNKIVQDCEQVEAAKLDNGTIDALHAECLLLLDSRDRNQLVDLAQSAKPIDAYVEYIQARVGRAMPGVDSPDDDRLLVKAFADPANLPLPLKAPFRRATAAKLLIATTARTRVNGPIAPATALANPFRDEEAAGEAYGQLGLARALSSDIEAADLKLNDAQQRDLLLNLALAARWKTKPDAALAKSLAESLANLSDTELGRDAFPALYLIFLTHKDTAADQPVAIKAAQRLTELFQKQFSVADPIQFYSDVIQPALALADAQSQAKKPPTDLDKFYAVAADFISHYQRATKWPFADKQVEQETLLIEGDRHQSESG